MTSPITIASVTKPDGSVDLDRLGELVSVAEDMRVALGRQTRAALAFMRYFDPNDLPEDSSQQWQQLEHQSRAARAAYAGASAFVASVTDEAEPPPVKPSWPFEPSAEDLAKPFDPGEGRDS